jgi:sialidase-1
VVLSLLDNTRAEAQTETGIRQIKVFEAGQGGYHTYRVPALVVTTKGTMLAFCEGRKNSAADCGNSDLVLRRSTDAGQSWSPVQVILDDGNNTVANPCPIVDRRTGAVVLLMNSLVTTSRDDGETWSPPINISDQVGKPEWRGYLAGPGHGIQLMDGRLVAPCYHVTGPRVSDVQSHIIFSDDGGLKWQLGGSADVKTDESTVLERADGSLYINMRNYRGTHRRACSFSRDRGLTWSPVIEDAALVESVCQGSVLRFSTDRTSGKNRVLFSNPASRTRREKLTVRVSYDECQTWPVVKTLWPGPAAYSDLAVMADRTIGCLFECGEKGPYETITLALFTLDWLTQTAKLEDAPRHAPSGLSR